MIPSCVFFGRVLKTCVKIGEGVYGEVFRVKQNSENVALKVSLQNKFYGACFKTCIYGNRNTTKL